MRNPNEMVTAVEGVVRERAGVSASAATFGTRGTLPADSMPSEKSAATLQAPVCASSWVDTAVPAATSSTLRPGASRGPARVPTPTTVLPEGEQRVGAVVSTGDPVEHRRDLPRVLLQPGASHGARA